MVRYIIIDNILILSDVQAHTHTHTHTSIYIYIQTLHGVNTDLHICVNARSE